MPDFLVPYKIPYYCQFASPELVRAFVYGERDIASDPRWAEYGAVDAAEYAHWSMRACGVVCIKMAVEGITGSTPQPIMHWVRAGLNLDGYLLERHPPDFLHVVEIGWKHISLGQLAANAGCSVEIGTLTLDQIAAHVHHGQVIVASVSAELGEDVPITRRSGHLVLIYGITLDDNGQISYIILHNPSGRCTALQRGARIPVERFKQGFSGRGIVIAGC